MESGDCPFLSLWHMIYCCSIFWVILLIVLGYAIFRMIKYRAVPRSPEIGSFATSLKSKVEFSLLDTEELLSSCSSLTSLRSQELESSLEEEEDDDEEDQDILPVQRLYFSNSFASSSESSCRSQEALFGASEAPFIPDSVRETLEGHQLTKRLQQQTGLPSTLLKSQRAFLPPAPNRTFRSASERDVVVEPRTHPILFRSEAFKRNLEEHLRTMIEQRGWGLPRRIREILASMGLSMPDFEEECACARVRRAVAGMTHQHFPFCASTSSEGFHSSSQAKKIICVGKNSLQIRQKALSKLVEPSQKDEEKRLLPKLILHTPTSRLQEHSGPSLLLRCRTNRVAMNLKCKSLHVQWNHQTQSTQFLPKMTPSPFQPQTDIPPQTHSVIEFRGVDTPFLLHRVRQLLESHVTGKKLQRQWGQPRLVRWSLENFLPGTQSSGFHQMPLPNMDLDVKVHFSSSLSFICSETARRLDNHIRKKIAERIFGFPRRVVQSLHHFMSVPLAMPEVAMGSREISRSLQGETTRRMSSLDEALLQRQVQECSQCTMLRRHMAKRAVEIHLELAGAAFEEPPVTADQVRECQSLPKMISRGMKTHQLRTQELSFVEREALGHLELNLIHKDLIFKWGLPTLYQTSLSFLSASVWCQAGPPSSTWRSTSVGFPSTETLRFIGQGAQMELEWHIRWKRLQHLWGLPRLVQRSLRRLSPEAPHMQRPGQMEVVVLPAQLSFLSDVTKQQLERNLRKRIIFRQWCLPKRVLESLWLLCPEMVRTIDVERRLRSRAEPAPRQPRVFPTPRCEALEKMVLHLEKKCLEVQLGVPLALTQPPSPTLRRPLPQKIFPGQRCPKPRSHSLTFGRQEDMDRLELTLRHNHLTSLWGRGTRFLEDLGPRAPRAPSCFQPPRPKQAKALPLSEEETPFLQTQEREALELHVKSKRLQHEWRLPGLLERSLSGFRPAPRLQTGPSKLGISIDVLRQDPCFLPQSTFQRLDFHLQRMKLQRQWGLPKRVLGSLKGLCPGIMVGPPDVHQMEDGVALSQGPGHHVNPGLSIPGRTEGKLLPMLAPNIMNRMEVHWARKSMEVNLELVPDMVRRSWLQMARLSRQPLPRNIPPGLMPQKVRTSSFPFLHAGKMDKIEMSVKCHHMAFLWGLGTLHLEALSGMTEPKPTPEHPGPRGSCIAFSESETPFLLEEERQALETHVSMKKIHHAWALPSLVQKSIMAFVPEPPQAPFPQKTTIEINIIPGELSFLSQEVSSGLEFHIHKRTIKQQWGLPRRVLQSLHLMAPRDGSHHQEPSDGQSWRSSLRWPVHGETPIRSWPMGARGAEQNILRRGAESILDTEILRKVAKKGTEMFFEASPIATEASCEDGGPQTGQAFLKVIPAGHGTRQPQSTSLTMVSHKEMGRMELAVQSHHLAPLWGLSKTYKEGLPGMGRAPSNLPHKYRQVDIEYMGIQTPFILKEVREALEFHVTKKRIHHTWALPGLVQKSIMAFVPGPPQVPFHQKTTIEINIIPGELSFLSQEVSSGLEFHIHKRTIKQQWGLPRRVLQSLRLMAPRDGSHHQEPSDGQSWRSSLRWPVHGKPPIAHLPMDARGIAQGINKRKGAESFLDTKILRKVARKDTEMFFEAPSTANEASCEDGGHQTGHAFLKVIPAGHGTRKPQSTSPTMVSHKEMGRMELAVQSHPLAPLWGLSKTYMHAGMGRAPSNLLHKYRQVDIEFLEIQTPFILKEVREALELHVTKKRIHHAWALPSLVQKSVMAFMQEPPQVPFHQKTTIDIEIIPGELSFLSQKVSSVLEFHIHKRTIKQQWGLPRRVLQSLCLMAPRDGSHHQEPSDGQSWRSSLRWPVHGETPIGSWPMGARGTEQDNLKRRGAESILDTKILRRVAKKDTEMVFEAPPAATEASFEDGGPLARQSLPKLIPPGHGSRQPRSTALTLASHKEMGRMELAVQRCHLASLWGLGKTYIEGLAGMGPGLSTRLPRYTQVDVEFLEMETPFLPKDRREALEFHVTWKRIHHTWSLPGLVQRSLEGFMGNTPSWLEPKKQEIKVHILVQEPLFLPEITRISLEQHLQRRKVKHVWSLPRQVLRSLKHHLPPSHPARVPPYSGKDFAEEDLDGEKEQMHRRCIVMTPFQEVGIQFLQDEDKKKLEYHIQWKKLHHQWGLPTTIQRSLQAFLAPSLLVPTSKDHPIGTVKEVEIQSNRPSFFSDLVQKDLEASLKKMAIHRAQDSLHAVSPATPAIGVQWPHQEEAHTSERSSVSGESSPWIIEEPREQSQRKLYGRHSEAKVSTCGKAMDLQAFQDGSRELLEFHIMHKKICRWWGLPLVVQNSLATLEDFKTSQEETLETTEKETTSSGGSHEVSRVWPEQRSQLWDNTDATDLQSPSTTEGRSSRESDYTSEESVMERVLAFTPELLSPPAAKEETAPEIYISSWTMEYESQGERWSSHSFHL